MTCLPPCLLCIDFVFLCRTYSSRGLSVHLSNSQRDQGDQEAALALHQAAAMQHLLMTRRMMTCTRS
jgi:hypothetical protein